MWCFRGYCLYYNMKDLQKKLKESTPKHRMEIPSRILADIELMFEDPNESNMKAFEEFKNTLIQEEMYTMLSQLHRLEVEYEVEIPFEI